MRFQRFVAAAMLCAAPSAWAQGVEENHRRVYESAVPSVVAVRATVLGGERSGSGVVLSADGLLLVSYSVVPDGASNIRVFIKGPSLYRAEFVAGSRRDEVTLIRVKPAKELKAMVLGDSRRLAVGQLTYTLGNAANSMINNDQPSLNVGVVSAVYRLDVPRANAHYTGIVVETTAAVNVGMEGAPLLDASGRMVGMVTLNYSPHRFLGCAIPVDTLKAAIEKLRRAIPPTHGKDPVAEVPAGKVGAGMRVGDQAGKLVVISVDAGSPAEAAGLRPGLVILSAGRRKFKNAAEFGAFVDGLEGGTLLELSIDEDGLVSEVKILLEARK